MIKLDFSTMNSTDVLRPQILQKVLDNDKLHNVHRRRSLNILNDVSAISVCISTSM